MRPPQALPATGATHPGDTVFNKTAGLDPAILPQVLFVSVLLKGWDLLCGKCCNWGSSKVHSTGRCIASVWGCCVLFLPRTQRSWEMRLQTSPTAHLASCLPHMLCQQPLPAVPASNPLLASRQQPLPAAPPPAAGGRSAAEPLCSGRAAIHDLALRCPEFSPRCSAPCPGCPEPIAARRAAGSSLSVLCRRCPHRPARRSARTRAARRRRHCRCCRCPVSEAPGAGGSHSAGNGGARPGPATSHGS